MFSQLFRTVPLAFAALLIACDTAPTDPVPWSGSVAAHTSPPVTLEWQATARSQVSAANMNALAAARLYAGLGVAQSRAVESVDATTQATNHSGGNGNGYGPGGRSRYEARRGAVAGASVRVLGWFAPAAAPALEAKLTLQGQDGPGGVHPDFARGVALGRASGDAVVAHLMNDGFTSPWTGSIPVGPGLWTTATLPPAGATLGAVTPWFLQSATQFRPAPPPAFGSPAFDAAVNEVLTITSNLTAQQRAIALGWNYGGGTPTPPGYWNALAASYVESGDLDEAGAAKVFAIMSAAVFDALIVCFEAKYHYWTLRPKQADAGISLAFPVPNYPAYPSGHGSVSSSAARVLAHFFPERAATLEALVDEAAISRIYAGIHYRFDMTAARQLGEAVADLAIRRGTP